MPEFTSPLAFRIAESTQAVFGESPITKQVEEACRRFDRDVTNIESSRGIDSLLVAIVGAKGQGKTWAARQFIRAEGVRAKLKSGDLVDDATTRLVWIGPAAPEALDPTVEIYHPCSADELIHLGQPYVLLDTPGITDANHRAAKLARESLSLAPIKLLVVARDQIRAAANMMLASQIDGSLCIPVISSVEPEEIENGKAVRDLAEDLRGLRDQLGLMAPRADICSEVLVPDFEISDDEAAASQLFVGAVLDRFSDMGITATELGSAKDRRLFAANRRFREHIAELIGDELPQLADAVDQLNRETENLPDRVIDALLGSESILETGVRMRLRARLVSETPLIWFPYRTVMSTLNLTQGAWDRVMLALAGSVPSLFGALSSLAKNVRDNREVSTELQNGIRKRTQEQVQERLRPLCEHFHRTVLKLRPRAERIDAGSHPSNVGLAGIEELQTRSQKIFDESLERNGTPFWVLQLFALIGVVLFWGFMAGPIVLIYKEYFMASFSALSGGDASLRTFPHPTPSLLFTSLFLSMLPVAIYCMLVLTWALSNRRVRRVAKEIANRHRDAVQELKAEGVIRLEFRSSLLANAEYLLNLSHARREARSES
ncbi:MAG: hypothetical protein AB8B50_20185 [Pirellulaceae bacterium]